MRSWQIVGFSRPLCESVLERPKPAGSEVLVRVHACGVCHSDVHLWEGYFDLGDGRKLSFAETMKLPFTIGHEIVGEIVDHGPDARDAEIGARRVVFPWIGCRACDMCTSDREHLCLAKQSIGTRQAGGFSDYVLVPHPRYLFDFGDIDEELACTYACSGITAYGALKKVAHLSSDDWILLIGAGGVGLSAVGIAPSVTPARIVVADIDAGRRQAALDAGADAILDNGEADAVADAKRLTGGNIWAAIDFVGRPQTAQFGLDVLHRGGTLVMVGLHGGALSLPLATVAPKLLTIRGSQVGTLAEMGELMELARSGAIKPIPIENRPMSEATRTILDLHEGRVTGRVVLRPGLA